MVSTNSTTFSYLYRRKSSMSATVNVTAKFTNIKVAPGREKFEDVFTKEMLFSQNLKKEKEFNRQIKKEK